MRIGSLFSGAGGLDMAVEHVFGGATVWHCENDAAASKVLAYRWPGVPNLGDITKVDWARVEPVDVLCGGWPCQPFSVAGKRLGASDERALWPHVAGAVRMVRPRIVVLENVSAVLGAGEFQRVADDLAQAGYEFSWTCVRASDVGTPHRRERLFVLAHTNDDATRLTQSGGRHPRPDWESATLVESEPGTVTGDSPRCSPEGIPELGRSASLTVEEPLLAGQAREMATQWGKYEPAIRRWELLTRPAPPSTENNSKGNLRLNPAFSEWMMGWPDGWVTQVPGVSRNDQLKIIGNGVCPQQATAALQWLLSLCGNALQAAGAC